MQKISKNVYADTGFHSCNCGFVVTSDGVVMIDTPQWPVEAVRWRDEIAKFGLVRYVINTEPHGDHFTGNYYFKGTVIAHEGTRQAIMSASAEQFKQSLKKSAPQNLPYMRRFYYRLPTVTFSQRLTFYVGDHTFQLTNLPGHTACQVAVFIPEEKVVFTSDNLSGKVQAWLHQALPYEWLDSLKKMQEFDANTFVPGHGVICDKSALPEMSAFIQAWIDAVSSAIKKGMSLEEAQNKISLLDRYPMSPGSEPMGPQLQKMNVARLYEVLKK